MVTLSKALSFFLFFQIALPVFGETPHHVVSFGGINEYDDPLFIDAADAVYATNVLTDEGDLKTIYGSQLYGEIAESSITFQGEYIDSDGGFHILLKSGQTLYEYDTAGSTSAIKAFSSERELDGVQAFDRFYVVDGTDEPFYYDGTSTYSATGMEDCSYIEYYQNRLSCVNMSTDTSKVYLTWANYPSSWTVTSDKNSAAVKHFHKNDGFQINCVKTTPFGLFIGKDRATGFLKGYDNNTFYWQTISENIGCIDDRTVQMVDNDLVWVSQEGVYAINAEGEFRLISQEITPTVGNIRKALSTEHDWSVNSQSEWEEGAYTDTTWDATTEPGAMWLGVYYSSSTELTHWGFPGEGGEVASSSWTCSNGGDIRQTNADSALRMYGDYGIEGCDNDGIWDDWQKVEAYEDGTDVMLASASLDGVADSYMDLGTFPGQTIYMKFTGGNAPSGNDNTLTSPAYDGLRGTKFYKGYGWTTAGHHWIDHPEAYSGVSDYSDVYDTKLSSPVWTDPDLNLSGATLCFYASDDGETFSNSTITASIPMTLRKRYYKYQLTYDNAYPANYFNSLELYAYSTGTYLSEVHTIGDNISSWRTISFSESLSSDDILDYQVRSATYAFQASASSPTWTDQQNYDTVAVTENAYFQFKIIPTAGVTSTDSVRVNSVVTTWLTGVTAPRLASVVKDRRYILAISTYSDTINHLNLIWQKNKKWMFQTGVNWSTLGLFDDMPIAGDATTDSKLFKIMQDDVHTFDGQAIDSVWETKDFTFALNNHKVLNRFWIAAEDCDVQDFEISYMPDRDGTFVSTTTVLNTGDFTIKEVEGLFGTYPSVRLARFRFRNSETGSPFALKYYSIYYTVNPLIK